MTASAAYERRPDDRAVLRAEAEVEWPSATAWQTTWAAAVRGLEEQLELDGSGRLLLRARDTDIYLVEGEHALPGASYELRAEHTPAGRVHGSIETSERGRRLRVSYAEPHDRSAAYVDVDSLDQAGHVSTRSSLEHLRWDGVLRLADPADGPVLRLRVRLAWLDAVVSAHVEPDDRASRLVVVLDAHGRGVWRPVLAPMIPPMAWAARDPFEEAVGELAQGLTRIARDPHGAGEAGPWGLWPPTPAGSQDGNGRGADRLTDRSWLATPWAVLAKASEALVRAGVPPADLAPVGEQDG